MAQFRTTADILDEILQKAGEVTNGNSPYESLALTYANKVHHAIIGGGNIFNIDVNEPWVWARSRFPIVLELQPAYVSGTITCTQDDINVTFSDAPSTSVEGWHFQVGGCSTVYKITQHTGGLAQAVIDSSFVDASGSYNFRVFKLDYEITPAYMYVDNSNDKIDFQETAATTLSTTLVHGSYTPGNLLNHVIAKLGAVGTAAYGGSYDTVLQSFNVTASVSFKMLAATGPNKKRSSLPLLGFDQLDQTGAQTYTSTYTPNQVSRLIEPFKLFNFDRGLGYDSEPFIYSTDPIKMQEDYPISQTRQRVPDRFVRIMEENDGTVWVRFNAYPANKTKTLIDWIPQPIDLQDNAASVPQLPRTDIDTLIHGAAAFIAFDKEDTKWEGFVSLTKAGIEAMNKKNRSLLFHTGETFAQQVPRLDLASKRRLFNYGYTISGGTQSSTAGVTSAFILSTLTYNQFQTAGTTATVTARNLPGNRSLMGLIVKHSAVFAGAGLSAVVLDVGISGDPTKFINGFSLTQPVSATAQDSSTLLYYPATSTGIQVRVTSTGGNLSALTQGSVDIYFQEVVT